MAEADAKKIMLDPEEDSQIELPSPSHSGGGLPLQGQGQGSDSDLECTGMDNIFNPSALASIYGR